MKNPKVLVIGDAFKDRYYIGTSSRLSPEACVPVVVVSEVKQFHGGAANVRENLEALGCAVRLVNGTDGVYDSIPLKSRLVVGNTQIARWDEYDVVEPIDLEYLDRALLRWVPDAIVLSDYGKGSVSTDVIEWLRNEEAGPNIPLFIDTKANPSIFPWASNVTFFPNTKEYAEYCSEYDRRPNVVFKRGSLGISRMVFGQSVEDHPAWAEQVVSVTGAGDTVIAGYVYASIQGYDPLEYSNAAAAVVVGKPYTSVAKEQEICEILKKIRTTQTQTV